MVGPDFDFEKMVRQDEKEETMLHEGADYDERDRDIVGFQTEKIENLNAKKRLSIKQKIEKELAYVTNAMGLDEGQQKHWAYKLKREYEAQAKLEKRMEERQAKKDYRKMLKKFGIKRELEDLEDYESFYNKTDSKA